jgi:MinD-like ATPase involved in chromosome partitioning or flagellar assembly
MSRLIAFWSPSGAGATTLLLNTAAALGARHADVAAVDLNLTAPSLALHADLLPHANPQSACLSKLMPALEGQRLTLDELHRRLLMAPTFAVLPGMIDVVTASQLTEEHVRRLLQLLTHRFGIVLVDVTPALDSIGCLPVLEQADQICLVVGPEIASRFLTRRVVMPLDAMSFLPKTSLIYNRAGGVDERQIASDIGIPVQHSVPDLSVMNSLIEAGQIAQLGQSLRPALNRFRTAVDRLATLVAQGGLNHAER